MGGRGEVGGAAWRAARPLTGSGCDDEGGGTPASVARRALAGGARSPALPPVRGWVHRRLGRCGGAVSPAVPTNWRDERSSRESWSARSAAVRSRAAARTTETWRLAAVRCSCVMAGGGPAEEDSSSLSSGVADDALDSDRATSSAATLCAVDTRDARVSALAVPKSASLMCPRSLRRTFSGCARKRRKKTRGQASWAGGSHWPRRHTARTRTGNAGRHHAIGEARARRWPGAPSSHLEIEMHHAEASVQVLQRAHALRHVKFAQGERQERAVRAGAGLLAVPETLDGRKEVTPAAQVHREEELIPRLERVDQPRHAVVPRGAHDVALHHDGVPLVLASNLALVDDLHGVLRARVPVCGVQNSSKRPLSQQRAVKEVRHCCLAGAARADDAGAPPGPGAVHRP